MSKNPKDISRLLAIGPKELRHHIENALLLKKNIKEYIMVYGMTKEELMKCCSWSQNQYYRRMKNLRLDELEKILKLAEKKS